MLSDLGAGMDEVFAEPLQPLLVLRLRHGLRLAAATGGDER
jgi:hypothetical protein